MRSSHPLLVAALLFFPAGAARADEGLDFFERKIRPVFVERCYKCHSTEAKKSQGGLLLDSRQGILRGGDSGPAVTPHKAAESLLIEAISYSGDASEMPPDGKLADRVVADFRRWIDMGAPLPANANAAPAPNKKPASLDIAKGREFWSFQPAQIAPLPAVADRGWPQTKLDYFVLARLEQKSLSPSAAADRRTLIKRVYFDLIGLPPTHEQVGAFAADDSPGAYQRLVDELLASPRYGERWGRHWLDVARYAEDNPTSESTCKPPRFPFRYRDWVIAALNDDLTYDQFRSAATCRRLSRPAAARDGRAWLLGALARLPQRAQAFQRRDFGDRRRRVG